MNDKINIATNDTYKIKGSINFSDIPTEGCTIGDVYSITDSFTADERFIPSEQNNEYPPDTNIVYTSEGWDVLGGIYDFSSYMKKDDIKPIDNNHITDTCIIPDPVIEIKVGDMVFNDVQDNITFDTSYDNIQTISLDMEGIGRGDLEYAITDTPVTSTFSRMRNISPYDSLEWQVYKEPFTLPYGNSIIYTRIKSVNNEYIYACSNGIHIHEYDEGVITTVSTCTTTGTKTYTCKLCSETKTEIIPIDPNNHNYVRTVQTPATLNNNRIDLLTCSRCGHSYTEEIPDTKIIPTPIATNGTIIKQLGLTTGDVVIPKYFEKDGITYEITKIGQNTFVSNKNITSVVIPDSVTSIGDNAFEGCSLSSIAIPNSVTSIGSYAFNMCSNLASINIPNSVTSIGSYAFKSCTSLTSITIPNSVTSIGDNAFGSCSKVTSLIISNSITEIKESTFYGLYELTSIVIPYGVTKIGKQAFAYMYQTSIEIPNTVIEIAENAFSSTGHITYYGTATGAPWGANSMN